MRLTEQRRFKRRLQTRIEYRSDVAAAGGEISASLLNSEIERFLSVPGIHLCTLFDIWTKEFGREEARRRWEQELRTGPPERSYRSFQSPPVHWYFKARSTSGSRKVCIFDPEEKLWHSLSKDLIVARQRPRPHIGDWLGRGRNHQIGQLLSAIASPTQAVVVADVRHAFESVNIDAVYDLRLVPEELFRRAVDYRTHTFRHIQRSERDLPTEARLLTMVYHGDDEVVPSGLMEGSPASNAIFSMLLDDLPDHLDERIIAFVYCDNIILLAPSLLLAQQARNALVEYFTGHRAGPFDVRSEVRLVRDGFDHLGYQIEMLGEGDLRVSLSPRNWQKFAEKIEDQNFGLAETLNWLATSFSHCSDDVIHCHAVLVLDEAIYRDRLAGRPFKWPFQDSAS